MGCIRKFEILKGKYIKYLTGDYTDPVPTDLQEGEVEITTTRGEVLRFWKEQIHGSRILNGDDKNVKDK